MPEGSLATVVSITMAIFHGLAIIAVVLSERRQPSVTLAWIISLIFLPAIGLLAYILFGARRMRIVARYSSAATAQIRRAIAAHLARTHDDPLIMNEPRTVGLLRLAERLSSTPATSGNHCRMLVDGAATYRAMIQAIEEAEHHIHVEFYIIQPDTTGTALRDRLTRRAESGVQVRVLVDAVGSIALPATFWKPLIDAGGEAYFFRPVVRMLHRLRRRDRIDFRNHRKIVVVDGHIGFTGGINVGREYLGLDPDIGRWRDTHIRIEGPAVLSLQQAFAEDWMVASNIALEDAAYYPRFKTSTNDGACTSGYDSPTRKDATHIVQVVDSGPDRTWSPMVHLFDQAIAVAQDRVWITNPYFVPDPTVEMALITAALRGVDVRLLLPERADHIVVTWASRSYYQQLLDAGVLIFEYARGFVHAKTMVVDDWVATIGSANMDMRSFHLNFELNAFVFGEAFVSAVAHQFKSDLENASAIQNSVKAGTLKRLVQGGARLLSPLL